ncbi:LacI family DNA-binding transcriptional regulator [Pontiella sulfatireligans]|uniref:HTH-type transcriptional regulator GalS n=1 Tax=Pontiella sulfatireligans TaxID=2750658 RepID=A0A6C2UUG5_9BACT|nr:LacI family DNA-binding transcriptional regulator [Pontiella sulfatireligans]VGO22814.1 HTH-type transcriptional regulator GalS [Pontiella sulfatireligans]
MAVSQKQIAERLGVSIALVSRVLSGKARDVGIAEATIEKVLAASSEMGYVPSAAALTLKGKGSRTIGVVVYDFRDPFFGAIIEKLQEQAHEQNYSLVLAGFKGRQPEPSDLAPLHKHAIDGLVVLGSAARSEWLEGFLQMPVARIGHGAPDEASVRIDEADAAEQLLRHLVSKGCRRCAFIGSNLFGHTLRFQAFKRAAQAHGVEIEKHSWAADGFEAGLQATLEILEGDAEGLALVCATDIIAMCALHVLHDAGRRLPVTGFDDIPSASQFIPPITTVRQPIDEMAQYAFQVVLEQADSCDKLLKGALIVRSSS